LRPPDLSRLGHTSLEKIVEPLVEEAGLIF